MPAIELNRAPSQTAETVRFRIARSCTSTHILQLRASMGWVPVTKATWGPSHTITLVDNPADPDPGRTLHAARCRAMEGFGVFLDQPLALARAAAA